MAWFANWRQRNPYRYGHDRNRSAWEATNSGTDLLGHMIEQRKRRTGLPRRGMLP
jgi:hypothetical protein